MQNSKQDHYYYQIIQIHNQFWIRTPTSQSQGSGFKTRVACRQILYSSDIKNSFSFKNDFFEYININNKLSRKQDDVEHLLE